MTRRIAGWESRLASEVEAARSRRYVLGETDCFMFALLVVRALTGVDLHSDFRGSYSTKREALKLVLDRSRLCREEWRIGDAFDDAGSEVFGSAPAPISEASRGDICKFVTGDEPHFGVCLGQDVAVLVETGLAFIPRALCAHCWKIG